MRQFYPKSIIRTIKRTDRPNLIIQKFLPLKIIDPAINSNRLLNFPFFTEYIRILQKIIQKNENKKAKFVLLKTFYKYYDKNMKKIVYLTLLLHNLHCFCHVSDS